MYKASRRREYERLRAMDEEVRKEKEEEGWEEEKREREEKDREKTRKNREKRERLKNKKGKGKKGGDSGEFEKAGKGGGVKARIDLGKEGHGERDEEIEDQPREAEEEVKGVIIHDDD